MKKLSFFVVAFALIQLPNVFIQVSALDDVLDQQTLEFAEGYDKRLRYTPSTVTILDREYIENSGALTVAELLEHVVGIHMTRKAYGASSSQFIRGIDNNLLILHNGVQNYRLVAELLAIPVVDLDRIEVVKGSHYPLYGVSAVAGTVNLVTRGVEEKRTSAGARVGSSDTKQVWLAHSDIHNELGYSAYISFTTGNTTEGVIDVDNQTSIDNIIGIDASFAPRDGFFGADVIDARLTLEFGDRWTLHQFINHREFGTGIGLGQSLDPSGQEVATFYSADLRYARPVGLGEFEARVTYNHLDLRYNDLLILPPGTLGGGVFPEGVIQRLYEKIGNDVFAEGIYRISFDKHTLDFGIGGGYGNIDNGEDIRNYSFVSDVPPVVPLGGFMELSDEDPLFGGDISYERAHVLFRDRYNITKNVSLNIGGRIDYSSDIDTVFIPRLGIDWVAGQHTNVGLLYGESVQSPPAYTRENFGLFFAQGDENLKPERIQLLELSFDHKFNDVLSVKMNLYAFNLQNNIAIVSNTNSPDGRIFVNVSEDENGHGAEIVFDFDLDIAKLTTGISIVNLQSQDQSAQKSPRVEPYANLNIKYRSVFNANFALIGVTDRSRRSGDNRPSIDDYAIFNVTLIRKNILQNGLNGSIAVQNLFGSEAREDISTTIPFDLPVYPRRILAGISYKF